MAKRRKNKRAFANRMESSPKAKRERVEHEAIHQIEKNLEASEVNLQEPASLMILLDYIPKLKDKLIILATFLGEKDSIKVLKEQYRDVTDILYNVLDNWISAGERNVGGVLVKPTWEYLLNVLRKPVIDKGDVADEIKKRLEGHSQSTGDSHHMRSAVERNTRLSSLKEESDRQERMSHNSEPNKSSVVTCSTAVPTPGGVTEVKGETLYSSLPEYQHVSIEQHHMEILQSCIIDEVPHKWKDIGIALGFSVNKLGRIKSSAKENEECLLKLFSEWIRNARGTGDKPRTFGSLLDVLVARSCKPEADALKEQLFKKGLIQRSVVTLQRFPLHDYHCTLSSHLLKGTPEKILHWSFNGACIIIIQMLQPYLKQVREQTLDLLNTGLMMVSEEGVKKIREADSVGSIFSYLNIQEEWNDLSYISTVVKIFPKESLNEAEAVLYHYEQHLLDYRYIMNMKKRLPALQGEEEVSQGDDAAVQITVKDTIPEVTYGRCMELWRFLLIEGAGIDRSKTRWCSVQPSNSCVITFYIPRRHTRDVIDATSRGPLLWSLLELGVLRISIDHNPGSWHIDIKWSTVCYSVQQTLLNGGDLLRSTKTTTHQLSALVDIDLLSVLQTSPYRRGGLDSTPGDDTLVGTVLQEQAEDDKMETDVVQENEELSALKDLNCELNDKLNGMEGMHHMTMVELHALKTKLAGKEEELKTSQNELNRTRDQALKYIGEVKKLKELVDIDLVEKVESLEEQLKETSKQEKEEEKERVSEESVVSLVEDKFYKYQVQIEEKEAILSKVKERMKNLYESEDLSDWKQMVELKESTKKEMSSIEELEETYLCDTLVKTVRVNFETISHRFKTVLALAVQLLGYDEKKKESLSTRKTLKESPVVQAGLNGNLEILILLLDAGHNVDEEEERYGATALLVACQEGHLQVVQHLTEERKANVYHKDKEDVNALHLSAYSGNVDLLKFVLPKFTEADNLHDVDVDGESIVHYASKNKQDNPEMVSYIVKELKFSPEEKDKHGQTPLMLAGQCGRLTIVKYLLDMCFVKLEEEDINGDTALLMAFQKGHLQVIQHLTEERKANVYHKNKKDANALHLSAHSGNVDLLKFVLPKFTVADKLHDVDVYGNSLVHFASRNKQDNPEMVSYIVEELKFSPEEKNKIGQTPLMKAVQFGRLTIVKYLLDMYFVKLEEEDNDGNTALLLACDEGHLQVVQHLTEERKANVYHKSKEDVNALHWSAHSGNVDLLKFVLPKFTEADKLHDVDVYGNSLVHYASSNKQDNPEMVSYIVEELKFSPEEKDKYGQTPLMKAVQFGRLTIVKYLLDMCFVKLEEEDNNGDTALLVACAGGHLQVVQHLTEERKANVYHKNKHGNTALHHACVGGHLNVVKYLLPLFGERKFDVNEYGKDCLTVASAKGHKDIVQYLLLEGGFRPI